MPPAPDLPESRLALVIGTASYTDPGFRQLRAPAQDVADMAEVLADPEIGRFTVTQVLDRAEYEIRRAIGVFLADRRVDDLVVVYLSCHGVLDARGRLYFAATDTVKSQLSSTGVESGWLLEQLENCRARRQVLILDCCFSGSFARTKGDPEVDLERRLVGAGRGRAVLTASRAEEYSYEGTPLPEATDRSVFTAGLVDGLRSGDADRDGDGYITVEDAYTYAADQVSARGGTQSPQRWLYGAEGTIVLARNPRGAAAAALPEALQLSLDSPYPGIRQAAVATLATWLTSGDPGQVRAAEQVLQHVAAHDSPTVAAAAQNLLHHANPLTPLPSVSAGVDYLPPRHQPTRPGQPSSAGTGQRSSTGAGQPPVGAGQPPDPKPSDERLPPEPPAPGDLDAAAVRRVWPALLDAVREHSRATRVLLSNATASAVQGDVLTLTVPTGPLARRLADERNTEIIKKALRSVLAVDWQVRCEHAGADPAPRGVTPPVL
ncbi:MAG: caspase, EACC1-associated type [Pseudonocardiaceae bacterium]